MEVTLKGIKDEDINYKDFSVDIDIRELEWLLGFSRHDLRNLLKDNKIPHYVSGDIIYIGMGGLKDYLIKERTDVCSISEVKFFMIRTLDPHFCEHCVSIPLSDLNAEGISFVIDR